MSDEMRRALDQIRLLRELDDKCLNEIRDEIGEAWFHDGCSIIEGLRRKTKMLERLANGEGKTTMVTDDFERERRQLWSEVYLLTLRNSDRVSDPEVSADLALSAFDKRFASDDEATDEDEGADS